MTFEEKRDIAALEMVNKTWHLFDPKLPPAKDDYAGHKYCGFQEGADWCYVETKLEMSSRLTKIWTRVCDVKAILRANGTPEIAQEMEQLSEVLLLCDALNDEGGPAT